MHTMSRLLLCSTAVLGIVPALLLVYAWIAVPFVQSITRCFSVNIRHSTMKLTTTELLKLDAITLRSKLEDKSVTSVDLINSYVGQIEKFDQEGPQLRAMLSVVPLDRLRAVAERLDRERAYGHVRSAFHGVPVLVKDSIKTDPTSVGVGTTVGSLALLGSDTGRNAIIVDRLVEAGFIILGKTNLNEFSNFKGFAPSNGWSAVGKQTQSAFVRGGFNPNDGFMGHSSPCGSSSGSGVGVSAGYAPLAIGTESEGSLVQPANRGGLYALKPTIGSVETDGIWRSSKLFVSAGGMTKSVGDLAALTNIILTKDRREELPPHYGFESYLTRNFKGLRIGFLDPKEWQFPPEDCPPNSEVFTQTNKTFHAAIRKIQNLGAYVEGPVSIPPLSDLVLDGEEAISTVTYHEYRNNVKEYLLDHKEVDVHDLSDIVRFNIDHADIELPPGKILVLPAAARIDGTNTKVEGHPDQGKLLKALNNATSEKAANRALAHLRNVSRNNGIDKLFEERNLNVLAFSMECLIASIAAAAGYPIATMPLDVLDYNGRPFALGIIAQARREDLMFQFMSAFEASFPKRPTPVRLLEYKANETELV